MTSAFIIYIHPQIQVDPNAESAALLRVLLYKTDETIFGDDVPEVPKWTGPPRSVVAALSLLYFSLASATAPAFITILAKLALNIYILIETGRPVTVDAPRQQLRRKRFGLGLHVLIILLSVSLQVSLSLLVLAFLVYVRTINSTLTSIMLFFILSGGIVYSACIITAVVYLDFDVILAWMMHKVVVFTRLCLAYILRRIRTFICSCVRCGMVNS